MMFSHPAMAGNMSHGQSSASTISTPHAHAGHGSQNEHNAVDIAAEDDLLDTRIAHGELDECCDYGCTVVGALVAGSLHHERVTLILEQSPAQIHKAVDLGQPTPPPNAII